MEGNPFTIRPGWEHGVRAAVIEEENNWGHLSHRGWGLKDCNVVWWHRVRIKVWTDYGFFTSEQIKNLIFTYRKNHETIWIVLGILYGGSLNTNGVELIEGRAHFVDAHTIGVNGSVQAKHLVIATGPISYPFCSWKNSAKASDMALANSLHLLPLVGAGYIAVELAGVLHHLGVQTRPLHRKIGFT